MEQQIYRYATDPMQDGLATLWRKGLAFARNVAIAGALAGVGVILLGAVLTEARG